MMLQARSQAPRVDARDTTRRPLQSLLVSGARTRWATTGSGRLDAAAVDQRLKGGSGVIAWFTPFSKIPISQGCQGPSVR